MEGKMAEGNIEAIARQVLDEARRRCGGRLLHSTMRDAIVFQIFMDAGVKLSELMAANDEEKTDV